jgi:predicted DNA-binding protein (MmcQ/YjbR family)
MARLSGDDVLAHCLGKPGAWQDEPWDGDVVTKVGGQEIFAFLGGGEGVGLKCGANRDEADELVDTYPEDVSKMAYIGRSGWNTVRLGGSVPDDEILELIDTSYETIVAKLPKSKRPVVGN